MNGRSHMIGGTIRAGAALACAAGAMLAGAGCAERIIRITSEPSDAMVTLNDVQVGRTPVEVDFTYFGVYDVRLTKQGYEPLATRAEAEAPFHEWPVVDLVAAAVPARKRTHIDWHFVLTPASEDPQGLIQRAAELRGTFATDDAGTAEAK